MEAKEILNDLRNQLIDAEKQGVNSIKIKGLNNYVDSMEKYASESLEYRAQNHELMPAHYAVKAQYGVEMLKAVVESGKSALNSIIVINGGAVIALMGVMSNLIKESSGKAVAVNLALPLLIFGLGVLFGAVGFACRYLSQAFYTEGQDEDQKCKECKGDWFKNITIAVAIFGYAAFGYGIYLSYSAFVRII